MSLKLTQYRSRCCRSLNLTGFRPVLWAVTFQRPFVYGNRVSLNACMAFKPTTLPAFRITELLGLLYVNRSHVCV